MSYARTATLLSGVIALVLTGAFLMHGSAGLVVGLAASLGLAAAAHALALRFPSRRSANLPLTAWPRLPIADIVRSLAAQAGIAPPRLFLMNDDSPNAFASGRTQPVGAIGVTMGLLTDLSEREIRGVLAHEVAHLVRRDARLLTAIALMLGIGGALAALSCAVAYETGSSARSVAVVGLPAAAMAMLIQMAISRRCEYAADRTGAELCGAPLWIAAALERIETLTEQPTARAHGPWALETFRFGTRREQLFALLSTHPPTSERIRRLRQQAGLADPWV